MTDWNSRYRNKETPWCKGRAHPMLGEILDRVVPADFDGRVVVPGCGRGWDLAGIAAARPRARVTGIDISPLAVADAARAHAGQARISVVHGDFLDAGWLAGFVKREGAADLLWEHTCFCALAPARRDDYVAASAAAIVPGGWLAGVFFLSLDDEGTGPPWNCPPDELLARFGRRFATQLPVPVAETFPGREGCEYAVWMRA